MYKLNIKDDAIDYILELEEGSDIGAGIPDIRKKIKDSVNKRRKRVKPITEPRYDDVFYEGLEWLDGLSHSDCWETDACATCSNNPKNNPHASGICHCTLGSPRIT